MLKPIAEPPPSVLPSVSRPPLNAQQTADLVELLKNPPAGEGEFCEAAHEKRTTFCLW